MYAYHRGIRMADVGQEARNDTRGLINCLCIGSFSVRTSSLLLLIHIEPLFWMCNSWPFFKKAQIFTNDCLFGRAVSLAMNCLSNDTEQKGVV